MPSEHARHWPLDPRIDFLNHGSYGAAPRVVLEAQQTWRLQLEHEPVRFMVEQLEPALDAARAAVGAFVGAAPDDLAFITNATTGVNTVLRSLRFETGDELLTTDHAYNAVGNAMEYVAARDGARVVVAAVPFPLESPDAVVSAVMGAVTPRTRLAVLDHVSSATALILPVAELVAALAERGVDTLVDGAHAPGMVELDVAGMNAAYYTGNLHKWVCAPKGAAFLWVRPDRQERIRPLVISHGANSPRADRSRFRLEFDWLGTGDPSAWLAVPDAIALRHVPAAGRLAGAAGSEPRAHVERARAPGVGHGRGVPGAGRHDRVDGQPAAGLGGAARHGPGRRPVRRPRPRRTAGGGVPDHDRPVAAAAAGAALAARAAVERRRLQRSSPVRAPGGRPAADPGRGRLSMAARGMWTGWG